MLHVTIRANTAGSPATELQVIPEAALGVKSRLTNPLGVRTEKVSDTTTPVEACGPVLVTSMLNSMISPAPTAAGETDFMTPMLAESGSGMTPTG